MDAEIWSMAKTLAKHLYLLLCCEVRAESFDEELASFGHEKVRATVSVLSVICRSSLDLTSHVLVIRCESITELRVDDAAIAIFIIASSKEEHFIFVREGALLAENFLDFIDGDPAFASLVKHVECVDQVEVRLTRDSHLCSIDFCLKTNHFTESTDELLFFSVSERGSLILLLMLLLWHLTLSHVAMSLSLSLS